MLQHTEIETILKLDDPLIQCPSLMMSAFIFYQPGILAVPPNLSCTELSINQEIIK